MTKQITAMLLTVLLSLSLIAVPASAASTLEEAMREVNVYARNEDLDWLRVNGSVKTQHYTYYLYRSELTGQTKEIPAYCTDPRLYGVPALVEEGTAIRYGAEGTVTDPKIMGICANGYPHIGLETLGVNSVEEAYYATKTALWCYLLSTWSIDSLSVNPNADQAAAARVLQATRDIYTRGMRWTKLVEPKLTAKPDRDTAYRATVNGESVYQQIFTVTSETWSIEPVHIALANGAPSGTMILGMNDSPVSALNISDATQGPDGYSWQVKVVYPASAVEGENGTVQLNLNSVVVQYELFHAKCLETDRYGNAQRYVLDTDPHTPISASAVSTYSSSAPSDNPDPSTGETAIKIIKLEEGTRVPLEGAVFDVVDPSGASVGSFSTTGSGSVVVPVSVVGDFTVTERIAPKYHLLPEVRTQHVTVVHGQTAEVTFTNAPFGSIRVEKVSDTGEKLAGVTVQIKHIATGATRSARTNSAGVAEFTLLPLGGYEVRETAGIEGWQFDGETVKTVAVTTGETSTVTFTNKELPGLRIIKYDRTTHQALPNVTFEITRDGVSLGEFTTDQMGEIVLTNARPGTYLVTEKETANTHIVDTTPQQVELSAGDGIRELVFFNELKPGLRLIKVDSADLSKPIPNAKFSIKKVEGDVAAQEYITDINGEIDLSRLTPGSYVVTELECAGYVIDEAQRIIELRADENAEYVFTNSIRPSLHLIKYSSDGSVLPGVSYRIAKIEDGTSYLDRTTDAHSEILISDLDPGVYSVREVATDARHILDLREFHIELFPGKTSTLVVENQIRPNLIVYKHDADTGEPIADTVFQVKAADGHSVDEIKTDANGKASLANLLPGVYEVSEKSVPADWLMDAPAQLITLYPNRDHTVYFENHKKPTLTVNKISSVTGKPLEGAKFGVTYGSNDTVTGEINDLGTFYTDENGQFTLTRLRDGWYKVTELASVDGFQPAEASTFQTLFVGGGDNAVMTFENVPLSAITVYKYDNVTGEAVRDAVFEIRYLTDSSGTGGTAIGRYKTGANGSFTVTGLIRGTYIVEELASDSGHVIDTAPQTCFLSGEDQDVVQLYFGNTPKGSVLIVKKDAITAKPLSGVEFIVADSSGAVLGNANGKYTTDASGSILIDGLKPGMTVVAKESRTISGYVLDDAPQSIQIKPGATVTLEFRNQPKGGLVIRKFDSVTKAPLPGAEFKVTMANGELTPDNEGLTSSNGLYTTDENGQITLSKLTPATYVISETKAPEGYALDNQTQTVVVNAGDTQTVSFYNEPLATLMLLKRDAVSKLPLANAEFTVKTADGTAIGTNNGLYRTDETGTATVTGIQPNTAVVVSEDSAPAGYVANATPKTIVVKSGVANSLTFDDEPTTTLIIHKYVEGTANEPLSGVGFRVTDSTGAAVGPNNGTYYTDRAGEIMLTGLAPGITVTAQEFKTVDGYVLDGTPQSVLIKDYQKMELTFWNAKQGSLVIRKLDAVTKTPLAGAEFQLTYADGGYVDNANGMLSSKGLYTTDSRGEIRIEGVTGTIVATEIKAPDGYIIGTDKTQTVVVRADETQTLSFYDVALQSVVIQKYIDGTTKPLAGVTFLVTDGAGNPIGSSNGQHVTDESGRIVLTGLTPGMTLLAREIKTVKGYELNGTPQTIVVGDAAAPSLSVLARLNTANSARTLNASAINTGSGNTLTFYDEPLSTLIVHKYIKGTKNEPLSGVAFKITDGNGGAVGPGDGVYYTNAEGEIIITDLEQGEVINVREVKTVDGYLLDGTPKQVKIKSSDVHEVTFWNAPAQTLTIQKYEAGTTSPIAGVRFKVTSSDGTVVGNSNGEFQTDRSGQIVLTDLVPGTTITAREVETVSGYVLNSAPQSILIKAGEAQTLTFYNERKGGLIVEKRDSVTDKPLAGAEFKITTIDGAYVDDNEGQTSTKGIYRTDSNGQIVLTNLQPNSYVIREIKAPAGYVLNGEEQSVKVSANDTQTLMFLNDPLQTVVIQKFIEGTSKPLPGVTFLITDAAGMPLGSASGEYVTDANGRITISGLTPGMTVVAREVKAAKGYVLNAQPQTIIVGKASGQTTVSGSTTTATVTGAAAVTGVQNGMTFYDAPLGRLTIQKYVEGTSTPLPGVRFLVTKSDGGAVGNTNGEYVTDANGRIELKDLEPGITVTAKELRAADGYVLDSTPKSIEIKSGDEPTQTLTFYNKPTGTLKIIKKDRATGAVLKGAEFELAYANGEFVGNLGGAVTSNGRYTTDERGEIVITGLQPSTVVIRELRAPEGYLLDNSPVTVEVATADTQTIEIFNDAKQTLTIQKYVTGTTRPIQGVKFLVTDSSGAVVGPNNGEFFTDRNGRIVLTDLTPGTTITAKELETAEGFVLDTTPQSILIKVGMAQTLTFYNSPEGGLELVKVNASDKTKRLSNVTFEIRRMDGGHVDTITTNERGRAHLDLDAGDYYAVEIEAAKGFKLDATPHYFTIKDGETTTLTVANTPFSGIEIHKIDSVTGEGIYGAKFLLYDAEKHPVGEYVSDQNGYIYIDNLTRDGKYFIRELECEGYNVDTQLKTVTVKSGQVIQVEWKNTPITGQLQVYKYAAEYNPVTFTAAGAPLAGAVFEIVEVRSGKVVDYITTDARGVAASKPLPLKRYQVKEVKAPAYWQVDATAHDVTLEYPGQIIKLSAYDKPAQLGVSITKRGNASVMAGQQMKYTITVANTSNVPLENFYWHDRIPTDVATAMNLSTGTYSARLTYRILYKTSGNSSYQVLASNLVTTNNYSFSLNAIPTQAGEKVTDVYFDFGKVPVGFQSTASPTLTVSVNGNAANSYSMVNRVEAGGKYGETWETATASWTTGIVNLNKPPKLPKTGY